MPVAAAQGTAGQLQEAPALAALAASSPAFAAAVGLQQEVVDRAIDRLLLAPVHCSATGQRESSRPPPLMGVQGRAPRRTAAGGCAGSPPRRWATASWGLARRACWAMWAPPPMYRTLCWSRGCRETR